MKKKQHHARRRAARGQETSKKNSPKGDSLKKKRRVGPCKYFSIVMCLRDNINIAGPIERFHSRG